MSLVAGNMGGGGNVNGTGSAANFGLPSLSGVIGDLTSTTISYGSGPGCAATDTAGNVYLCDAQSNLIRKMTPDGVVSTYAGTGAASDVDGPASQASFTSLSGIAVDAAGTLYVAESDPGNGSGNRIRKISASGVVTTLAGSGAVGAADGTGTSATFQGPAALAVDAAGNVYVTDQFNATIRKITPSGTVSTYAGSPGTAGSADGTGSAARFDNPLGIAVDGFGNLYVGDGNNFTIRKIAPGGIVTTFAGTAGSNGSADGVGPAAQFTQPQGLSTDGAGNLYVADTSSSTIRLITPTAQVTTLAGTAGTNGHADGSGAAASFFYPAGVAADGIGNVYVADSGNTAVRKIAPGAVVTTVAGLVPIFGNADGSGSAAQFQQPFGITSDSAGNLYVADQLAETIRMVSPQSVVTTLAGSPNNVSDADGVGTAAGFSRPMGISADPNGNLYVADALGNTIRRIAPGAVVTTVAGQTGQAGSNDGNGSAALFSHPQGVTVDSSGNAYIADTGNQTIRKMDPSGNVTTLAGTVGVSGSADGAGTAASFNTPVDLAVDGAGNVYVADSRNFTVRKILPDGTVTTLAGSPGKAGYADGTGSAAQFGQVVAVAVDGAGNVYAIDRQQDWFINYAGNQMIRKITPAGVVTTVAGQLGTIGYAPGPLPGALRFPCRLTVHGGSLYFTMGGGVGVVTNVP